MNRPALALLLALAAPHAAADLRGEVADACNARVGKHGGAAVAECVAEDLPAAEALSRYPDSARATIMRCRTQLKYLGAARVKACADRRLQAASALADYPEGYADTIESCRIRMGAFGEHMVKACVDSETQRLGAPPTQ